MNRDLGKASPDPVQLTVPESLRDQLGAFRQRVWSSKVGEALMLGAVGLLLAFLTVYVIDRFLDTPQSARLAIFAASLALWLVVPWALHRWVWRNRRLDQVARLLRVREPGVGDQLLSVIELAEDSSEQKRSRTLCAAAIEQVADSAKDRDLLSAAPPTRLRSLSVAMGLAGVAALTLWLLFPAAASNAWTRFSAPWRDTPRYTFTEIDALPPNLVVPHGESTQLHISLKDESRWQPASATLDLSHVPAITNELEGQKYRFELPALTQPVSFRLKVGDYSQVVQVEPKLRPELTGATAHIVLPEYLERSGTVEQDVRSGVLSSVDGSQAIVHALASRKLQSAQLDNKALSIEKAGFKTEELAVSGAESLHKFEWTDFDGLAGREPFELAIKPVADEVPTVVPQGLPRQAVVLESEQINFEALAADDYGVKRIGIAWRGLDEQLLSGVAAGEKVLAAGGPERTSIQVPATFCAVDLGIPAQPIEVELWVEDYLPGRERVVSAPHVLYVLTADEHAIWITNQMSKWHRAALEVRDKELQLHETNKRLRAMSEEELDDEQMRQELRRQASLEAANGRRLSGLAKSGEGLLRQASRNDQIGVGHLDRWAEMLQVLNDIGSNRMPNVSDLLDQASTQKKMARGPAKRSGPMAGQMRGGGGAGGSPSEAKENQPEQPVIPKVVDSESSMESGEENEEDQDPKKPKKKFNGSRQGLVTTTLTGPPPPPSDDEEQDEEEEEDEEAVDEAIYEQENLLEEFEKIADELNNVLANLEGSTLVKRLKAASREQGQVAKKIGSRISNLFGQGKSISVEDYQMLTDLTEIETESSQKVSYIMDDMQAYFDRRRMNQFKVVLDEMKEIEVLTALETLGEEIPVQQGMSIAQAEFWADSLDRWAEDLVDPACSGECPGCKTSDSLPPSVILEVLRILEGEVNLREATRVAEQARQAVEAQQHQAEATRLGGTQEELRSRTVAVVEKIIDLPDGDKRFAKEIGLLTQVAGVMQEAVEILATSETGSPAIAAETEAIELLLQCKRINPKGGGGGGSSPGGGGSGDTQDSALALLGSGLNQNERREARDVAQATGESGRNLPEEFRAGLDAYFSRIEQGL